MTQKRSKTKDSFGYGIFPENETRDPPAEPLRENQSAPSSPPLEVPADREKKTSPRDDRTDDNAPARPSASPSPRRFGAVGKKGEPLCLAELLILERSKGLIEPDYDETYERLKQSGDTTYLSELQNMSVQELVVEARRQDIAVSEENSSRQELIFQILKNRIKENGLMFGEGTLEILPDQFGFLRSPDYHYLSCPDDIYISPSQIRRFGLRKGCTVSGQIRPPKENERYFALLRVEAINREDPNILNSRPFFDNLTPIHPNERIRLSNDEGPIDMKIIDTLVPVGFGQRGLIVSPPRTGTTTLIQRMTRKILENYPEVYVFVLLVDQRPEEATEMVRQLKGPRCEVICSLFEEPPARHIHVAEIVLEKAKRMVEYGKNVVIFLDSMTRLARAWNADPQPSGGSIAEKMQPLNLHAPKKFFGAARKIDGGGSLTILATTQVDTDSEIDEAIFEQFKGTGNWEIYLDRQLADKRIRPALNIHKSSTRHEDILLDEAEFRKSSQLRRAVSDMDTTQAMDYLIDTIAQQ